MALSEWPTTPGAGDTECNVGCRCSLEAADLGPGDEVPQLSVDQQATVDAVAQVRSERMDAQVMDLMED
jgi:hypothetical protein